MSEMLVPLLGAAAIIAYWVLCRRRSLVYRERAAELLVAYFAKHSTTDAEVARAEHFYMHGRHWFFLPIMTILAFPAILMSVLAKNPEPPASKERMAITDAVMKMYLSRNPLIGTLCMAAFLVAALTAFFIGLMLNRVRAIPAPSAIFLTASTNYPHFKRHAH